MKKIIFLLLLLFSVQNINCMLNPEQDQPRIQEDTDKYDLFAALCEQDNEKSEYQYSENIEDLNYIQEPEQQEDEEKPFPGGCRINYFQEDEDSYESGDNAERADDSETSGNKKLQEDTDKYDLFAALCEQDRESETCEIQGFLNLVIEPVEYEPRENISKISTNIISENTSSQTQDSKTPNKSKVVDRIENQSLGKKRLRESDIQIHEVYIKGQRHLRCGYTGCGRTFTKTSSARDHIRVQHIKERFYECKKCHEKFFKRCHLNLHIMRVHKKEKPYICDICHQSFTQKGTLTQHMVTHTGERNFICDICGKCFRFGNCLSKHKRRIHE
ncbi:MAG: C2H2-type zinc finger protein [Candidatus Babeliales bacterium]